ncbi:MAG: hypothetical protein KBC84_01540 [Proteobacteria bacterium]|nr:hypothetical protein [Pseudomonadota bacterium]
MKNISKYSLILAAVLLLNNNSAFACGEKKDAECKDKKTESKLEDNKKEESRAQLKTEIKSEEKETIDAVDTYKNTSRHGRSHLTREVTSKSID